MTAPAYLSAALAALDDGTADLGPSPVRRRAPAPNLPEGDRS